MAFDGKLHEIYLPFVVHTSQVLAQVKSALNGFSIGLDDSYHAHFITNLDERVISHPTWMKTRIAAAQSLSVALQQETNHPFHDMF